MNEKIIAFGDVHLHWQAVRLILDYARKQSIDTALTLGDEGHKRYPYVFGDSREYDRVWHELRKFRDEKPGRQLIMTIGDKTGGIASDMLPHFVGLDPVSKRVKGSIVYRSGNVLAAHMGDSIKREHHRMIRGYNGLEPLVIFHGHCHSIGVLPEFRWLYRDEMIYWLQHGEEQHVLEPGKVYWINAGSQFKKAQDGRMAANFAIYDPTERLVTLKTVLYDETSIKPRRIPAQYRIPPFPDFLD